MQHGWVGGEKCIQGFLFSGGRLKERGHLEDRHRWEDNIKIDLKERVLVGSHEHSNRPLGSTKAGNFSTS